MTLEYHVGDSKSPKGHALNFLIPRKIVEPATPENLKKLKARIDRQEARLALADETFQGALSKLGGQTIDYQVEANEQGHLFKGIKGGDIALHLKTIGSEVLEDAIYIPQPIKEVGKHTISLASGDAKGEFVLNVVAK